MHAGLGRGLEEKSAESALKRLKKEAASLLVFFHRLRRCKFISIRHFEILPACRYLEKDGRAGAEGVPKLGSAEEPKIGIFEALKPSALRSVQ